MFWTNAQDTVLTHCVKSNFTTWPNISKELLKYSIKKSPKQCRERWNRHLMPGITKKLWTKNEDMKLEFLICTIGVGKWSLISKKMMDYGYGRTDISVKRRYQLLREKQKIASESKRNSSDNEVDEFAMFLKKDLEANIDTRNGNINFYICKDIIKPRKTKLFGIFEKGFFRRQ